MSSAPRTLTELFFDAVQTYGGHAAAFRYKADGAWRGVTHQAAAVRVQALSLGLRELGLGAGEKVAILAETRLEWALTDYACLCARATDVPIYPTLPANQVEYILRDAGAAAVVCSTAAQVEKIHSVRGGLPSLRHVIVFDATGSARGGGVLTLAELEARGRAAAAKYPRFKEEALAVRPDDLATLIYTSGTTGDPKGVVTHHRGAYLNAVCNAATPFTECEPTTARYAIRIRFEESCPSPSSMSDMRDTRHSS